MSVQFGRWNLDGRPVDSGYLERVATSLAPYGPDGGSSYNDTNISILYRAFHTTKESRLEAQPHISTLGDVITWDGRLDNRAELISELHNPLAVNSTDVAIVAAAYEKWGTTCFAKLIGDWAVSIWNSSNRSLLLAKDAIGTRHLYYSFDRDQITWSTVIDPLVRFAGKPFGLNEEYVAGWLSMFPAAHLTPYVGVDSVPPSSFVLLRPGKRTTSRYWDFDPNNEIRYRADAEYEEHFRTVFATAVRRRLRSDRPVLAELSGGRDSSSIVCMADQIIARSDAETPRLDTISYFDDDEPNWNERPYFTKVEEKRGRRGCHVDIGMRDAEGASLFQSFSEFAHDRFVSTPGGKGRSFPEIRRCIESQGNRVVLSGIGGDEVMGGVPTPVPEVADLLARAQLRKLAHQLKVWALEKKRPWHHLFWEAACEFLPTFLVGVSNHSRPAPWVHGSFAKHNRTALTGYPSRTRLLGALPSFQHSVQTLDVLRRQLACSAQASQPPHEKRYPYLDRDLLEFMFAVPREQLVRPTQRRSLMRRGLIGIVPDEILHRKTKAFVSRAPMVEISNNWAHFAEMTQDMLSDTLGIVNSKRVSETLQKTRRGEEVPIVTLQRTLCLEGWLKDLRALGIINLDTTFEGQAAAASSIHG